MAEDLTGGLPVGVRFEHERRGGVAQIVDPRIPQPCSGEQLLRGGWQHDDHVAPDRRHLLTLGIGAYTPTGVIGRPSLATAEKGRAALHSLGENSRKMIKNLTEAH